MAGINKVILVGHVGRDPELKYNPSGMSVAKFSIATSMQWKDKNTGEKQERTEWHRIVAFAQLAEFCGQYIHKGRQIYVEGRLQTRDWEDRDGNKRYTTEIVAQNIQLLGPAGREERAETPEERFPAQEPVTLPEDDIPF